MLRLLVQEQKTDSGALVLGMLPGDGYWDAAGSCPSLTEEPVSPSLEEKVDGRPHLSASRLLERRKVFGRNLMNLVKQHHKVWGSAGWTAQICPKTLRPAG